MAAEELQVLEPVGALEKTEVGMDAVPPRTSTSFFVTVPAPSGQLEDDGVAEDEQDDVLTRLISNVEACLYIPNPNPNPNPNPKWRPAYVCQMHTTLYS